MELQMSAERRKRSNFNSEGIANLPSTALEAKLRQILDAEAVKGYYSGGSTKTIILQAQAERQQQVLKAQAQLKRCKLLLKRSN